MVTEIPRNDVEQLLEIAKNPGPSYMNVRRILCSLDDEAQEDHRNENISGQHTKEYWQGALQALEDVQRCMDRFELDEFFATNDRQSDE